MLLQYTARKEEQNRGYVQVTRWLQSDPLTHCFLAKQQPTICLKNTHTNVSYSLIFYFFLYNVLVNLLK